MPDVMATATRRPVDLLTRAHDASHYLLIPEVVVTASDASDVAAVMAGAARDGKSVTFRSGGTSLAGQASTNSILLDTRQNFRGVTVLDNGARVRCQPGATVRNVNAHLARYGYKLGPDPASEIACTIGGVVSNNSSGMACGTEFNSYRTIESMVVVLPSGTIVDTSQPDADEQLRKHEPALWEGLGELRDRVRSNPDSVAKIKQQYSMKNTMGYGMNSFIDHDEPVHILEHLIVGSEGTLGWVASVTFRTVKILPNAATALLVVPDLAIATDALEDLLREGAQCLELLDAASLRVVQQYKEATPELASLKVDKHAGLLIETTSDSAGELQDRMSGLNRVLAGLGLDNTPEFTQDPALRANLWVLRKGLYTSVAGARPAGTQNLLEDIAVPVGDLTAAINDLQGLFDAHHYDDAVIFGHAKDGNIHFMINPHLDRSEDVKVLAEFTDDVADMILGHEGTLKAEHGTGRAMAPYVRRQFGDELYDVMQQIKRLADPRGVLNPGVLLNEDHEAAHQNLKTMPPVDEFIDRCVECGYCEPTCPSKDITTTPRRRIALLRTIAQADEATAAQLRKDFDYEAVDTCAVDSLCAVACPVKIDTGVFMKTFRADRHSETAQNAGEALAEHWGPTVTGLRGALTVAKYVPGPVKQAATGLARTVLPKDLVPLAGKDLPGQGAQRPEPQHPAGARFVYFSSCMGSLFAPSESGTKGCGTERGVVDALFTLTKKAGLEALVPDELSGLCCGTPWVSKGFTKGADAMARKVFDALWQATDEGRLPVVCDAASCSHGLADLGHHLPEDQAEQWSKVQVLDAVTYVAREVLPQLQITSKLPRIAVHPTCSTVHLGVVDDLVACAKAAGEEVVVPTNWGCCGFAGDRGMLHPELTESATREEVKELSGRHFDAYVSANRTCEMGMARATGQEYRHVLEVLAERV